MLRIISLSLLLSSCSTIFLKEFDYESNTGVVAIRGRSWDHEKGVNGFNNMTALNVIRDTCEKYRILAKGVQPTHAGTYWTFPLLGLVTIQSDDEEYFYRFKCDTAPAPFGNNGNSTPREEPTEETGRGGRDVLEDIKRGKPNTQE